MKPENLTPKAPSPKIVKMPYDSHEFKYAWEFWLSYKKSQFGFNYLGNTEQTDLDKLKMDSFGFEDMAIEMISDSIAGGFQSIRKKLTFADQELKDFHVGMKAPNSRNLFFFKKTDHPYVSKIREQIEIFLANKFHFQRKGKQYNYSMLGVKYNDTIRKTRGEQGYRVFRCWLMGEDNSGTGDCFYSFIMEEKFWQYID